MRAEQKEPSGSECQTPISSNYPPLVFRAKKSRFGDVISSHYLNVTACDLQDVLTTIPEYVVPTADSVWMELPYRDVCNRDTFYPAVTTFVKQCKHYHVPFIMLYADRDSVEYSSFKETNQMTERLTCSCQYPEPVSYTHLTLPTILLV